MRLAREHVCRLIYDKSEQVIIGFYIVCVVVDELHILNIVVAKAYQGKGFSHMLMHSIMEVAQKNRSVRKLFLEVRMSNMIAQNLYRQWQFEQIAIRKGYYQTDNKEREDAVVMVKKHIN